MAFRKAPENCPKFIYHFGVLQSCVYRLRWFPHTVFRTRGLHCADRPRLGGCGIAPSVTCDPFQSCNLLGCSFHFVPFTLASHLLFGDSQTSTALCFPHRPPNSIPLKRAPFRAAPATRAAAGCARRDGRRARPPGARPGSGRRHVGGLRSKRLVYWFACEKSWEARVLDGEKNTVGSDCRSTNPISDCRYLWRAPYQSFSKNVLHLLCRCTWHRPVPLVNLLRLGHRSYLNISSQ